MRYTVLFQFCFAGTLALSISCQKPQPYRSEIGATLTRGMPGFGFMRGPHWPPDSSIVSFKDEFLSNGDDTVLFCYLSFAPHGVDCTSRGWAIGVKNNQIEATVFRYIHPKNRTTYFKNYKVFERKFVRNTLVSVEELCAAIDSLSHGPPEVPNRERDLEVYVAWHFGGQKTAIRIMKHSNLHLSSTENEKGHDFYGRAFTMVNKEFDQGDAKGQ